MLGKYNNNVLHSMFHIPRYVIDAPNTNGDYVFQDSIKYILEDTVYFRVAFIGSM